MRRLEGYGHLLTWVMGAWQEGSMDLHELLEVLADNKVAVLGLARGREASSRRGPRSSLVTGGRSQPQQQGLRLAVCWEGWPRLEKHIGVQLGDGHGR